MKSAWMLPVGLLLIALVAIPMISAFANPIITSSSNNGAVTTLKNPSVKPPPAAPSLLSRIGTGTKNLANLVASQFVIKKSTPPPSSQFVLGSHAVGTTAEAAAKNQKDTKTTGDWLGLKRIGE